MSRICETEPWGRTDQRPFFNAVAELETHLEPEALLDLLQSIEHRLGRRRRPDDRWGPRPIDLDILRFGRRRIRTARLTVPHPRMHERPFVLDGLRELTRAGARNRR
jgi:2-amino-4-hydroxy-6-hydroxymethyldihydropteridine diphosphokinase